MTTTLDSESRIDYLRELNARHGQALNNALNAALTTLPVEIAARVQLDASAVALGLVVFHSAMRIINDIEIINIVDPLPKHSRGLNRR